LCPLNHRSFCLEYCLAPRFISEDHLESWSTSLLFPLNHLSLGSAYLINKCLSIILKCLAGEELPVGSELALKIKRLFKIIDNLSHFKYDNIKILTFG